jgi:hypothetical protein
MSNSQDDLKPEYSPELIKSGARGKYAQQYKEGTNVVVIEPDLMRAFPNAKAVNDALRKYLAEHSTPTER